MRSSVLKLAIALEMALTLCVVGSIAAGPAQAAGATAFDAGMRPVLESYLKIQEALAGDSVKGVRAAANHIAKLALKIDGGRVSGQHAEHYKGLPTKLEKAAVAVAKAASIEAAREAFRALSRPMAMWASMSKPPGVDVVFCSMAKGSWLQKTGTVMNPYYGKSMLHCGEVVGGAGHAAKAHKHGDH